MKIESKKTINWFLDLAVAEKAQLPFKEVGSKQITCNFQGMDYFVKASKGSFAKSKDKGMLQFLPEGSVINLMLSDSN